MDQDAIEKILTANDTGQTGSHQSGIAIPKRDEILLFFPHLSRDTKNPREIIEFMDPSGHIWKLNFIYYNNRFYGGTRNEYRLTGIAPYIRSYRLVEGDTVKFSKTADGVWGISHMKSEDKCQTDFESGQFIMIDVN